MKIFDGANHLALFHSHYPGYERSVAESKEFTTSIQSSGNPIEWALQRCKQFRENLNKENEESGKEPRFTQLIPSIDDQAIQNLLDQYYKHQLCTMPNNQYEFLLLKQLSASEHFEEHRLSGAGESLLKRRKKGYFIDYHTSDHTNGWHRECGKFGLGYSPGPDQCLASEFWETLRMLEDVARGDLAEGCGITCSKMYIVKGIDNNRISLTISYPMIEKGKNKQKGIPWEARNSWLKLQSNSPYFHYNTSFSQYYDAWHEYITQTSVNYIFDRHIFLDYCATLRELVFRDEVPEVGLMAIETEYEKGIFNKFILKFADMIDEHPDCDWNRLKSAYRCYGRFHVLQETAFFLPKSANPGDSIETFARNGNFVQCSEDDFIFFYNEHPVRVKEFGLIESPWHKRFRQFITSLPIEDHHLAMNNALAENKHQMLIENGVPEDSYRFIRLSNMNDQLDVPTDFKVVVKHFLDLANEEKMINFIVEETLHRNPE